MFYKQGSCLYNEWERPKNGRIRLAGAWWKELSLSLLLSWWFLWEQGFITDITRSIFMKMRCCPILFQTAFTADISTWRRGSGIRAAIFTNIFMWSRDMNSTGGIRCIIRWWIPIRPCTHYPCMAPARWYRADFPNGAVSALIWSVWLFFWSSSIFWYVSSCL